MNSDSRRKATLTIGPTHAVAMAVFGIEHVFHQFKRDTSQINVGLDKCIINSAASIGIKELLFELEMF